MGKLYEVILKELKLKEGEEFRIKGRDFLFKFQDGKLFFCLVHSRNWEESLVSLNTVLKEEIILPPFSPKMGEEYFTYGGGIPWCVGSIAWRGTPLDYAYKKLGIIFRTRMEALKALPEKYEEITGEKWY